MNLLPQECLLQCCFLPDITKTEHFCVKLKLFMLKMVIFCQRYLLDTLQNSRKTQNSSKKLKVPAKPKTQVAGNRSNL